MTLKELFTQIADAIRSKKGTSEVIAAVDFPDEIGNISSTEALYYEGEYTVIPKTEEQTLKTANKVMSDNLVVEKIPYYEVTNTANGKTVTIA